MLTISPEATRHWKAKRAAYARDRSPDDPDLVDAARNLLVSSLGGRMKKALAEGPQLTPEQIEALVSILRGGTRT